MMCARETVELTTCAYVKKLPFPVNLTKKDYQVPSIILQNPYLLRTSFCARDSLQCVRIHTYTLPTNPVLHSVEEERLLQVTDINVIMLLVVILERDLKTQTAGE
jgi:hypothetical protein